MPAASAARIRSASTVLVTATRRIDSGERPQRPAAARILSRTRFTFSATRSISTLSILGSPGGGRAAGYAMRDTRYEIRDTGWEIPDNADHPGSPIAHRASRIAYRA